MPIVEFEPKILVFCCSWCSYAAADLAGTSRMQYPANIRILRVPCSGRVDLLHVVKAFERGWDGVLITGCLKGQCHYLEGNLKAETRVSFLSDLLEEIGFDSRRLRIRFMSAAMAPEFVKEITVFKYLIQEIGPSPFRKHLIESTGITS
ncbi:MAG: hydrogenase iron-sulfur subunit [Candidatus Heimdallarchaeota archaeon]